MVPYAYIEGYNGGLNLSSSDSCKQKSIYLRNCCVACLSAAEHRAPNDDIALVTNIDFPEPYKTLLHSKNIHIIHFPFDLFNFGASYKWSLAFYKLCALYHASHDLSYDFFSYVDTDVFIQSDFSNIWMESERKILLYDIDNGLQSAEYSSFIAEVERIHPDKHLITHYGGEFFAANKENAQAFSEMCLTEFQAMDSAHFVTTHGDEFILSIAADNLKSKVKNAGAYIYRFWTGSFRLISTNYEYNPVTVLHVPAEKHTGMLKLYQYYLRHNRMPTKQKTWRFLHLRHGRPAAVAKMVMKRILSGSH